MKEINPLKRIDVSISEEELLKKVVEEFNLGSIKSHETMKKGLSEANFKLTTNKDIFLVKVFSDNPPRTINGAKNIIKAMKIMYDKGISVPKINKSKNSEYIINIETNTRDAYASVMEWFDGEDFTEQKPTDEDLKVIIQNIVKINKLSLNLKGDHDSWFVLNLEKMYKECSEYVEEKYKKIIYSILQKFKEIDLSKFQRGTIHGDIQREHVLKNKDNEIKIIDFMLNEEALVAELAITMIDFCMPLGKFFEEEFIRRYNLMLNEYKKGIPLSDYEISILPILLKAQIATYFLGASRLIKIKDEPHCQYWIDFMKRGLDYVYPLDF